MSFAHDHPSLVGHFPGNPVIAGVLILDQVRQVVQQWQPGVSVESLPQVKFSAPLLPGQPLMILLDEQNGKIRFRCESNDIVVAHGELRLKSTL